MLAERARTTALVAAVTAAAAATLVLAVRPEPRPAPGPAIVVMGLPPLEGTAIEITDLCPPHVRGAIHLGADAVLYCVRGQFPQPGTFVFARYLTTEPWERFAVVADDGELIVPMLDRPAR